MHKGIDSIRGQLPRITVEEALRRFSSSADIQDAKAFVSELQSFVYERVEAQLELASREEMASDEQLVQEMQQKAASFQTHDTWQPDQTDVQRGRLSQLMAFNRPHNLTVSEFAKLAAKSRQQIYKDIETSRLLALDVGRRGQKIPDWQLDPIKRDLTQKVLERASDVDAWTVYRALSDPLEGLGGKSPVEVVRADTVEEMLAVVMNVLGLY